jgi:hypothetical protein
MRARLGLDYEKVDRLCCGRRDEFEYVFDHHDTTRETLQAKPLQDREGEETVVQENDSATHAR